MVVQSGTLWTRNVSSERFLFENQRASPPYQPPPVLLSLRLCFRKNAVFRSFFLALDLKKR